MQLRFETLAKIQTDSDMPDMLNLTTGQSGEIIAAAAG
jgi:hypothetical protein